MVTRLQSVIRYAAAAVAIYFGQYQLAANILAYEYGARRAAVAKDRARRAFNESLRDRLELVDIQADAPRTLVLGRVRYVEGVRRRWTSGTNDEKLTMIVSFAGHEIDGFEQWYLDDVPVTLDVNGWVKPASLGTASGYLTNTAGYAKGATAVTVTTGTGTFLAGDVFRIGDDPTYYVVSSTLSAPGSLTFTPALQRPIAASAVDVKLYSHPFAKVVVQPRGVSRTGDGTVTLEAGYIAGTAVATYYETSPRYEQSVSVSVSGLTATVSGSPGSGDVTVAYQVGVTESYVRIRPYLGTSSQNVGNDLAAEYPGKIRTTDRFAGIALAVVDLIFNPDVFPSGRPTPTAVLRGAKCYDPRLDSTVPGGSGSHRANDPATWQFSESPPVLALRYFMWSAGWNCLTAWARLADVQAAANVCDASTSFTVDGVSVSLPRYRCGIVIPADADKRQAMDSVIESMAGRDCWVASQWRMRAGELGASVFTIDQAWLGTPAAAPEEGIEDGEPWLRAVTAAPGRERTNRITGSCVDAAQRYQVLPFPPVEDATLVAAKGERQREVEYMGVTHIAHAQNLAKIDIRQAQAGFTAECAVGWQGLLLEPLDVGTLNLPGYSISGKTVEVAEWVGGPDVGIGLRLQEITAALFSTTDALNGRDPAPDSTIRRPWDVEQLTGLTVTSGTADVTDTSILQRVVVEWDPTTQENIRSGGQVEIQFTPAAEALPDGDWPSWVEGGDSVRAVIPGVMASRFYVYRARFVQKSPPVRGAWSDYYRHQTAARRQTTIFVQSATPTGDVIDGDEWFDSDDGNAYYIRDGGSWVLVPTGTGGLQDGAAAVISTADQGVGSTTVNLTETDILTLTIDTGGFPTLLSATVTAEGSLSARDVTFKLKVDGTVVLTKTYTPVGDSNQPGNPWGMYGAMLQHVVTSPGTGTKTIKLTATGSHATNGVTVRNCNLYVEAKKK